jgi:hypothetical protein
MRKRGLVADSINAPDFEGLKTIASPMSGAASTVCTISFLWKGNSSGGGFRVEHGDKFFAPFLLDFLYRFSWRLELSLLASKESLSSHLCFSVVRLAGCFEVIRGRFDIAERVEFDILRP